MERNYEKGDIVLFNGKKAKYCGIDWGECLIKFECGKTLLVHPCMITKFIDNLESQSSKIK